MAYTRVAFRQSDAKTRQVLMAQGATAGKIRIHPSRCNCRKCRRILNRPKNSFKN